jgi:hypothetical protein
MGKMERSRLNSGIDLSFLSRSTQSNPITSMVKTLLDNKKQLLFYTEKQASALTNVTGVI